MALVETEAIEETKMEIGIEANMIGGKVRII